jgi:hypothetical protein
MRLCFQVVYYDYMEEHLHLDLVTNQFQLLRLPHNEYLFFCPSM